jgi:hypothetical protein
MSKRDATERAGRFYALLLMLYPRDHRRAFGAQMLQTFKDQYRDEFVQRGKAGFAFWFAVVSDEAKNSAKERIAALRARHILPYLLSIAAILLVASSFLWMRGYILYVKIPVALLLLIGLVAKRFPRRTAAARQAAVHVWARHGLRFGGVLGLLWVALNLADHLSAYDSPLRDTAKLLDLGILFLGMPILFGLAGCISSRKSGAVTDGMLAGLLAAAIGAAIMILSLVAIMILFWDTVRADTFQSAEMIRAWHASGDRSFDRYLWGDNLGGALAMSIVSLIFGGLLGTLGGALGASLPRNRIDAGPTVTASAEGIE